MSPQYHVVFDDHFATFASNGQFDIDVWHSLVSSNRELHPSVETTSDGIIVIPPDHKPFEVLPTLNPIPLPTPIDPITPSVPEGDHIIPPPFSPEGALHHPLPFVPEGAPNNSEITPTTPTPPIPFDSVETSINNIISPEQVTRQSRRLRLLTPSPPRDRIPPALRPHIHSPNRDEEPSVSEPSPELPPVPTPPRRSTRNKWAPDRLTMLLGRLGWSQPNSSRQTDFKCNSTNKLPRATGESRNQEYISNLKWDSLLNICTTKLGTLGSFIAEHQQHLSYDNLVSYLNPALLITMANKDDNPTFNEAISGPDAAGFMEAMKLELNTLIKMETFNIIDKAPWMKIISSVWAFKRKRYPDGSIRKLKARLCARGFEQREGVDYFETFAPVVQWLTVRLILIMTILMNLETKQIDYTSAFVQAKIDTDVYMEMPRGFSIPGKV